jgi:hypothetical protein
MTTTEQATALIGVFQDQHEAQCFIEELRHAGFRTDQIGIAARSAATKGSSVEEGATAGALTGGALGVLAGIAVVVGLIPGIGPVIAGGVLGSILASTATGAAAGGLLGALVGLGIPEEEARHYESELMAGRTLVVVQGTGRLPEALAILRRCKHPSAHSDGETR